MSHAYYNIRRAFLALVLLLTFSISQSYAQWVQMPPLSQVRNLSAQAILSGKLYIWGGTATDLSVSSILPNGASVATGTLLSLPSGPSWTSLLPMPTPRSGAYAAAINNKIYIVGGNYVQGSSANLTASVLEFDPAVQTYTELEPMPTPVIGPAYAHIGTKIYVFGGFTLNGQNVAINDITQEFDVATGAWTTHTGRLPYTMAYGTATAIGQKIMLVAGASVQSNQLVYTRNAYMGTPTGNNITWTKVADYPTFVSQAASGTLSGKVYVAGGKSGAGTLSSVYRFDEAGNKWDPWYVLPYPVANIHTMPSDGTSLYLASGGTSKNVIRLSEGTPVSVAAISQTDFFVTRTAASTPQGIAIRMTNNGVAPLSGTVVIPVEAQSWLTTPNQIYNNIAGGASGIITLMVGGPSVPVGNYKTNVTITTNDPNNPSFTVTVRLFVRETLPSQPAKVVIEESSGSWCGPCGAYGIPLLRQLKEDHGDDIILIAYHDRGGGYPEEMATTKTEDIGNKLGVPYFPSASFQRIHFPGQPSRMIGTGDWVAAVDAVKAMMPNSPVAMTLKEYQYNLIDNKITAKLEFTTTQAIPWNSNMSLRVTAVAMEDSLEYPQNGNDEDPFYHMHVARDFWPSTTTTGKAVTVPAEALHDDGTVLLPNQTFTVDIEFTPANLEKPKRSEVVFLVHTNQGSALGPILQGMEHHMTESIGTGGGVSFNAGTTTKTSGIGTEVTFESTITNAGSSPIQITAMRTGTDYPANWTSRICVVDDCGTAVENSKAGTVPPNSTRTFKVRVTPGSVGTGKVTLRFADGNGYEVSQEYTVNAQASGVSIDAVAGNGMRLTQNTPNPATNITRFGYTLPKLSDVMVDVYSMNGEKVLSVAEGIIDAGDHAFDLNVSSIPNGIYTVRLTASGTSVSRTITVTR